MHGLQYIQMHVLLWLPSVTHSDAEPAWPMLLLECLMMYVYVCSHAAAATATAGA
jgi:hypothetical protein